MQLHTVYIQLLTDFHYFSVISMINQMSLELWQRRELAFFPTSHLCSCSPLTWLFPVSGTFTWKAFNQCRLTLHLWSQKGSLPPTSTDARTYPWGRKAMTESIREKTNLCAWCETGPFLLTNPEFFTSIYTWKYPLITFTQQNSRS